MMNSERARSVCGNALSEIRRLGAGGVDHDEAGMLALEELTIAAAARGQEHARDARHLVVERQARLAHEMERGLAGVVAGAVADVHERPLLVEQVRGRDLRRSHHAARRAAAAAPAR